MLCFAQTNAEISMIQGFLSALAALTIFRNAAPQQEPRRAFVLISFPIVGAIFGVLAFCIVMVFQSRLPYLTAWLIPLVWLALSGASHFLGLNKSLNAFLALGSAEDRRRALTLEGVGMPGTALGVLLICGKVFALLQSQILDTSMIALTVLLAPVLSRYVAVMMAISEDDESGEGLTVLLAASAVAVVLSLVSLALALALLVTALVAAMLFRWISMSRLESTPTPTLGAIIEISETAMLWIPVVCTTLGLNLAMLRLTF